MLLRPADVMQLRGRARLKAVDDGRHLVVHGQAGGQQGALALQLLEQKLQPGSLIPLAARCDIQTGLSS